MRILVWAPFGSGRHYWGPGVSAHRLFSAWRTLEPSLEIDVAHGSREHVHAWPYDNSHFVASLEPYNALTLARYIFRSKQWLNKNAKAYDIFYGLSFFEHTVRPAFYAHQNKLKTIVKSTGLHGGLKQVGGLTGLLGLAHRRRELLKKISATVSISSEITAELRSYGFPNEKIQEIPNAVDTTKYCPVTSGEKVHLRKTLGLDEKFTVIFVGGMSERKAPHLVAQSVQQLRSMGHQIQGVFVGPLRDPGYASRPEIGECWNNPSAGCYWVDHVDDVSPWLKASDVFVLPSASEGLSNAMLEAMACGVVPIVTRVSGANDAVEEAVSGTFIERSQVAITKALDFLASRPSRVAELSMGARDVIVRTYSYTTAISKYKKLFGPD